MLTKKEEEFQNKNNAHALFILTSKHKHIHKPLNSSAWTDTVRKAHEFIYLVEVVCMIVLTTLNCGCIQVIHVI